MFAASTAIIAWALLAPPSGAIPKTTLAELDAMVKAGNYHLIRQQKLGHQIEAVGVVKKVAEFPVGPVPLLALGDSDRNWSAFLYNVPKDHDLKPGDRVKFRALITDEAYSALHLWAYTWSKVPVELEERRLDPKPNVTPAKPILKDHSLAGRWLLTMPRGFEYDATLEPGEEPGLYRIKCGATNLTGLYEVRDQKLVLVKTEDKAMAGLVWEIKNANTIILSVQPSHDRIGSDYRGATLGRQKPALSTKP